MPISRNLAALPRTRSRRTALPRGRAPGDRGGDCCTPATPRERVRTWPFGPARNGPPGSPRASPCGDRARGRGVRKGASHGCSGRRAAAAGRRGSSGRASRRRGGGRPRRRRPSPGGRRRRPRDGAASHEPPRGPRAHLSTVASGPAGAAPSSLRRGGATAAGARDGRRDALPARGRCRRPRRIGRAGRAWWPARGMRGPFRRARRRGSTWPPAPSATACRISA